MKSKFLIDFIFIVIISVISSYFTYQFVGKKDVQSQVPKIAILSFDTELSLKDFDITSKEMQQIAIDLKKKGDELSAQGFIVIDASSVVSYPDEYRAN